MTRHSRMTWLEEGLKMLAIHGVDSLTIDNLCQQLQVTKGSFYHHFPNRDGYLEALLQHWEAHYTTRFIEISLEGETPVEQINRLLQLVIETHDASEVAIRAWAQVDPLARTYLQRVDGRRVEHLYQLQKWITGDEERAQKMAKLLYIILIGAAGIIPPLTQEELRQMYELVIQRAKI